MPVKPTTKRCNDCKRKRIKCDEAWPNCGACTRAGLACSGPSNERKFVHSEYGVSKHPGNEQVTEASWQPILSSGEGGSSLKPVRRASRATGDDSLARLFGVYRRTRTNPTTQADRLGARLVKYLENGPSHTLLYGIRWLDWMPNRFESSPALRDAVTCLLSAWTAYHKGAPADTIIDPKLHGKALRSLQRAINDPQQQFKCETLAAVGVVQRIENFFDPTRRLFRGVHVEGIRALMLKRGPAILDDELDICLMLESHSFLIVHCMMQGGSNFFLESEWQEAVDAALDKISHKAADYANIHRISFFQAHWPPLLEDIRRLGQYHEEERTMQASILYDRIASLVEDLDSVGLPLIDEAYALGRIVDHPDASQIAGERADFENDYLARVLGYYAQTSIVFNRMMRRLADMLGYPMQDLDEENTRHCRTVWKLIPRFETWGKLGVSATTLLFMLTTTGANEVEFGAVVDYLVGISNNTRVLPRDRSGLEELARRMADAFTGGSP